MMNNRCFWFAVDTQDDVDNIYNIIKLIQIHTKERKFKSNKAMMRLLRLSKSDIQLSDQYGREFNGVSIFYNNACKDDVYEMLRFIHDNRYINTDVPILNLLAHLYICMEMEDCSNCICV